MSCEWESDRAEPGNGASTRRRASASSSLASSLHHKVFDERCHSSDRGRVEEAPKRQVQLELLTHARNELRRKQRMTPQLKKALGDSNGPNAQQLAPHFGDETFC